MPNDVLSDDELCRSLEFDAVELASIDEPDEPTGLAKRRSNSNDAGA